MLVKIDFESEIPIYEQLKRQIIIGIATGDLSRGEKLPSVRQLAGDIGINLHAVNKAYNILKNEGYLIIDRRKGAVRRDESPKLEKEHLDIVKQELKYLAADSKNRGMKKEEFLNYCSKFFDGFNFYVCGLNPPSL